MNTLISAIEARIVELQRRLVDEVNEGERKELEELIKGFNQEPIWKHTHHWECPKNQQIIKYTPLEEIWKIFDKLKKTNGHSKEQHSYGTISKINTDSTSIPKLEHNFPDIYNDLDEEENNETKEYDENAELDGYPTDIEDDDDFHYLDYSDQEEIDSL